jgi:hypothetical protein
LIGRPAARRQCRKEGGIKLADAGGDRKAATIAGRLPRHQRERHPDAFGLTLAATSAYRESTDHYRIQELIGYGELPFVAMAYDLTRGRRSHGHPIGRYDTLDEAKDACERHRQTTETNGTVQFTEAGDPLPRKFWE